MIPRPSPSYVLAFLGGLTITYIHYLTGWPPGFFTIATAAAAVVVGYYSVWVVRHPAPSRCAVSGHHFEVLPGDSPERERVSYQCTRCGRRHGSLGLRDDVATWSGEGGGSQ